MNVAVSCDEKPLIARDREMPSRYSRTGCQSAVLMSRPCAAAAESRPSSSPACASSSAPLTRLSDIAARSSDFQSESRSAVSLLMMSAVSVRLSGMWAPVEPFMLHRPLWLSQPRQRAFGRTSFFTFATTVACTPVALAISYSIAWPRKMLTVFSLMPKSSSSQ